MALPQHLVYAVGGTIYIDVPSLPSNAQVRIFSGDGTEQRNTINATISTINTTLSSAASKGALSISVAANTGINVGSKFYIQDDREEILVRKIAGTTISLRRPLCYDHISGAKCEGGRIYYTVPSNVANCLWWDGYAQWNIDGSVQQYTSVECTTYPLKRLASSVDMSDIEPKMYYIIDTEADVERLLDLGHEEVLKRIGQMAPDQRVRVMPSSEEWRHASALAAWWFFYAGKPGADAKDLAERYNERLEAEIKRIIPLTPRDADQDGTIEEDEKFSTRSRKLIRS